MRSTLTPHPAPGYLLEHADGDVVLARFGAFVLGLVYAAVAGYLGCGQLHGVAQATEAFGYLSDLFVHVI